jgi:hypothetical protein
MASDKMSTQDSPRIIEVTGNSEVLSIWRRTCGCGHGEVGSMRGVIMKGRGLAEVGVLRQSPPQGLGAYEFAGRTDKARLWRQLPSLQCAAHYFGKAFQGHISFAGINNVTEHKKTCFPWTHRRIIKITAICVLPESKLGTAALV